MNFSAASKAKLKDLRDLLYNSDLVLSVYPGSMEEVTSSTTTSVTVSGTVRKVMSVWLATDTFCTGTNYYPDPNDLTNISGSVITLPTALPNATTDVKVAYYDDCPDCEYDDEFHSAGDPDCSTCSGLGMVLDDGTAISVPIKVLPRSVVREERAMAGEITAGVLGFRIQSEYENLFRAAVKVVYDGRELQTVESGEGVSMAVIPNAGREFAEVEIFTEYKEM